MQSLSNTVSLPETQDLDRLAATVRDKHAAVGRAAANLLQHAMDVGDALAEAKDRVERGNFLAWVKGDCDLSERTAQCYMMLARARSELEANPQRAAGLSLRGALRLIKRPTPVTAKPRRAKRNPAPAPLSSLAWSEAPPDQRTKFVSAVGLANLVAAAAPRERDACAPALAFDLTQILKVALSTISTEEASTALGRIKAKLASSGLDLHDISIALGTEPMKRAA